MLLLDALPSMQAPNVYLLWLLCLGRSRCWLWRGDRAVGGCRGRPVCAGLGLRLVELGLRLRHIRDGCACESNLCRAGMDADTVYDPHRFVPACYQHLLPCGRTVSSRSGFRLRPATTVHR